MASIIGVQELQHTNGTSAMTIASDGKVTMANTTEIDMWRLTSNQTSNATITSWARPTYTGYSKAGTGMTHNSGIFTFPSTGVWQISFSFRTNLVSTDTSAGCIIDLSTDTGANFTEIAGAFENRNSNASCQTQALINCTNTSTFQVRFRATGLDTNSNISSHTSRADTNIIFYRITDSQ